MELHTAMMQRCLQLARKGEGHTASNPMVGAVVVHGGKIIGEGYHRQCGGAHAEVNAIASVREPALLPHSTLYVSLEPCNHYGKTPPCTELIISKKIPRVVVATPDPNPQVAGKGIERMRRNGIEVDVGLLEEEARELNRLFFANQRYRRPYIFLKWAQSSDGFMDHCRTLEEQTPPVRISNDLTQTLVHKLRTEVQGILVGTRTALLDNPRLNARKWFGNHPVRMVIDRENRLPDTAHLLDGSIPTLVFTASVPVNRPHPERVRYVPIEFNKNTNEQILKYLHQEGMASILVEGGATLLHSFILQHLWDEAWIEISEKQLFSGIRAPQIDGIKVGITRYSESVEFHLKSKITRNFL